MTDSFGRLWQWKGLWAVETLLLGILLGAVYGWLALPVAKWWHIALHVAGAAVMAGLVYFAVRLVRRKLAGGAWKAADPAFWLACVLWLLVGLWLPYRLVFWVPDVAGMTAQAVSAGIRFVLAAVLFTGAWMWLAACAARPPGEV
jgi:hypothetical protein